MRDPRTVPAPRWEPPLARETRARRRPILIAAAFGSIFAGGGFALEAIVHPMPRLMWNVTASVPVGLYAVSPARRFAVGEIIVARLPDSAARLAATRHYLPLNVPLIKRVGAGPGARVCAIGPVITIDGHRVAIRLAQDRLHRPLPWWNGCTRLRDGWLFLLSPVPESFDGRYFGPIDTSLVVGRARPMWTRPLAGFRP